MAARKIVVPPGMEHMYDMFHYAPAIQAGDTLYLTGQIGRDKDLNVVEGTEEQFIQAFENVKLVLEAAGATFSDVVELETYFNAEGMAELKAFLKIKDRYFGNSNQTWTALTVAGFTTPGILVEIKCTAVIGLEHP